jgi:dUTP pyrophosphatase
MQKKLIIEKTRDVKTPERGTSKSAGIDFFIPNDIGWDYTELRPNESIKLPSGIKVDIPEGYMFCAFNKSGVALKGLQVGACVIDEDYQGELSLHMINMGNSSITIKKGMKIVQFVLIPVSYLDVELSENIFKEESERGSGGFGSTGE